MKQIDTKSMVIGMLLVILVAGAVAASGGYPVVRYELFTINTTTPSGAELKITDSPSSATAAGVLKHDTQTGRVWALTVRNNKADKWVEIK
jgi:hypothetical protein